MIFLLRSLYFCPVELLWDELDWIYQREYLKSECELFQFLVNAWEGLSSFFWKKCWKYLQEFIKQYLRDVAFLLTKPKCNDDVYVLIIKSLAVDKIKANTIQIIKIYILFQEIQYTSHSKLCFLFYPVCLDHYSCSVRFQELLISVMYA